MITLEEKYGEMKNILKGMGSVLVAYSGGVDSTLLLKVSSDVLRDRVLAVIARSATYPKEEAAAAEKMAEDLGVRHMVIETEELSDERFLSNPKERCYFCKAELFWRLKDIAEREGIKQVVDGSNVDDASDFRPGAKAKKELGVRSPLAEAGFSKADIRKLSKELGLATWDKPSLACLASRVPYGTRITDESLKMIGEAEKFIRSSGFKEVRVRHHGLIARIELGKEEIPMMLSDGLMDKVVRKLESLGYMYVTIDLEGYRTGSLNKALVEEIK